MMFFCQFSQCISTFSGSRIKQVIIWSFFLFVYMIQLWNFTGTKSKTNNSTCWECNLCLQDKQENTTNADLKMLIYIDNICHCQTEFNHTIALTPLEPILTLRYQCSLASASHSQPLNFPEHFLYPLAQSFSASVYTETLQTPPSAGSTGKAGGKCRTQTQSKQFREKGHKQKRLLRGRDCHMGQSRTLGEPVCHASIPLLLLNFVR